MKIPNLERIAVHDIVLKPGERTSHPHAESHEEEFVYVVSGRPHAWLDGWLHELRPGHALGFPAGTGIAHTILNNTTNDVRLIVAGERTKPENRCAFPLNPEMRETSPIYWEEPPRRPLGPHNGEPGPVRESDLASEPPPYLAFAPALPGRVPFHYPGDNETFGRGHRLTDSLGLKALGIWHEILEPGRRSSWPHAHRREEEVACVLTGQPKLWLNGFVSRLEPGTAVVFAPGTGDAHCLINDSGEPVSYLGFGEAVDPEGDQIHYPLHPLRNEEMARIGWLWKDRPAKPIGPHPGTPERAFPDHLRLSKASDADTRTILEIYSAAPEYFLNVEGRLPTAETVAHDLRDGPKKTVPEYFKEFLIVHAEGRPVGVADLHANHPETGITYIGLLLLRKDVWGRGLGRRAFLLVEDYARRALKTKILRLGISRDNEVTGFWRKMGFAENGRSYEWKGEAKTSAVIEMDKPLVI
ncbi:MAG TPA: GNAT family N-acetyltransferase [Bdellovibrionales bacterium]|nr:GNAT family N-acetyltransferase [Bdellovibrionales bacterium]